MFWCWNALSNIISYISSAGLGQTHLRCFIAQLCLNLLFCPCLLIMCAHNMSFNCSFFFLLINLWTHFISLFVFPSSCIFSFVSQSSWLSPKPCGTRHGCRSRVAWARTAVSWPLTAPRLYMPAPPCVRAPGWLWSHPTCREDQKLSSALNPTNPQNPTNAKQLQPQSEG